MAALIVYGRSVGASLLTRQLWTWALLMGAMGFLLPGVDNSAHIGGFAGGWLTATLYLPRVGRTSSPASTFLALGLLAATALAFLLPVPLRLLGLAG
jgi:rhomboid protease GluP